MKPKGASVAVFVILCHFCFAAAELRILKNYYQPGSRRHHNDTIVNGGPRIAGGQGVGNAWITYQLHLSNNGYIMCGATLLDVYDVQVALTATHCLWTGFPHADSLLPVGGLRVTAGDKRVRETEGTEEAMEVDKVVPYPGFDIELYLHDIAIIFLKSKFHEAAYIQPVALPRHDYPEPETVRVSGWGSLEFGQGLQNELQWVIVPVMPHEECRRINYIEWEAVGETQMCVGRGGLNQGTCSGDSGGPAVTEDPDGTLYLVGVISHVLSALCGKPDYPGVLTRVSKYVDWIKIEVSKYKEASGRK